MRDSLGDRMKGYETEYRNILNYSPWIVIRLDGKAFHTYTREMKKPFDASMIGQMSGVMKFLCEKIDSTVFAYTQSDEISLVLNQSGPKAQMWFGGNVQKMVSVSAGYAAGKFNRLRSDSELGVFDARVFTLPDSTEVLNYLRWRQADCTRNALFLAASEFYSPKELYGKNARDKVSMLAEAGKKWSLYPVVFRLGVQCSRVYNLEEYSYTRRDTGETESGQAVRSSWRLLPALDFFQESASNLFGETSNVQEVHCRN